MPFDDRGEHEEARVWVLKVKGLNPNKRNKKWLLCFKIESVESKVLNKVDDMAKYY
jgi:hypothetical protein